MQRRLKISSFQLQGEGSWSAFRLLSNSLVLKLWKAERRNGYETRPGLIGIALAQGILMLLTMVRSTCLTVRGVIILMAQAIFIT